MANEAQHRIWRDDIRSNIQKVMEIVQDDSEITEQDRLRADLALQVIGTTGNILIAERIGELGAAIYNESELVTALSDQILGGKNVVERCKQVLTEQINSRDTVDPRIDDALNAIDGWIDLIEGNVQEVDQRAAPLG